MDAIYDCHLHTEFSADSETPVRDQLEKAISQVVKGKTLLVIAHRLPSVKNADKICVMEKGRLVDSGTHEELLERCGAYRKLWKASVESARWQVTGRREDSDNV